MLRTLSIRPEKLISLVRAIFLLAVLGIIKLNESSFIPLYQVNIDILAMAGVAYIFLTAFLQQGQDSSLRTRVFVALDFLFVTLIVVRTGGFRSNFILLYLLPIVQSSVRNRMKDAAVTASATCVIQLLLAFTQGLNTQIVAPMYWRASLYIGLSAFLWIFLVQIARESRSHQRRVIELASLVRLNSELASSLDIDEMADKALEVILPLFEANIGAVSLVRDDTNLITRVSRGLDEANWASIRRLSKQIIDSCATDVTHRKITIEGGRTPEGSQAISLLFAPLPVRDKVIGILVLGRESSAPWAFPEMALYRTIADRIATHVDTASLYNETKRLAITDELTGTYNHRFFHTRMEEEIRRADRYNRPISVVMVDVDHFKKYNDTHGHLMGDEVLRGVANTLKRWTRVIDVVSRYGGDEFTLLLPETDEEGAFVVAKRLKTEIEETYFPLESYQPAGAITVSMGIASFPENGISSKELIKSADDAMYRAKETRNTICCATTQVGNISEIMKQLAAKWHDS